MVAGNHTADNYVDLALDVHLCAWAVACVLAFAFFYALYDECRYNPEFEGQLHCLSGVILCGRELFGTLLCGFGGAVLLASVERVRADEWATLLLMIMFAGLMVVVHYDVRAHKPAHFTGLGVLLLAGTLYLRRTVGDGGRLACLWYLYVASTSLFVVVLACNVCATRWAPPFMTLQALAEIVWATAFLVAVVGFALLGD